MSSAMLLRAEVVGLLFWGVSLVYIRRATASVAIFWHVVGAALSLGLPVAVAVYKLNDPATTVVRVWLLGCFNGLLGAIWCRRVEPKVSVGPMLVFTLGGIVLVVTLVLSNLRMTRMF
jgi:hypothetical protein